MFSRLVAVLPFALLVAAGFQKVRQAECPTSSLQCCTSSASSTDASDTVKYYNLDALDGASAALTCTPIVGGIPCSQEPMCCNENTFNGIVAVGCSPINGNL